MSAEEAGIFQLGVNYWPVRGGPAWWRNLDLGEVGEDFDRLRELRLPWVRVLLPWPDFQPERDLVEVKALDRLVTVAGMAHQAGLSLWLTLFSGYAFGVNWLPHWMVEAERGRPAIPTLVEDRPVPAHPRNPFADPRLRQAQHDLLDEVLAAMAGHPALACLDLGHRPGTLARPTRDDARRWLEGLTERIRRRAPGLSVALTLGVPELQEDTGLDPALVGGCCDRLGLETFPAPDPEGGGRLDPLAPLFWWAIARWLSGDREVWITSTGVPVPPEAEAVRFVEQGLPALARHGVPGALWCAFADPAPVWWRKPPFDTSERERHLGLLDDAWRPKASLRALRAVRWPERTERLPLDWLDSEPERYRRDPAAEARRLYRGFRYFFSTTTS